MVRLTQSYAHGVSTTPLIGDTIGVRVTVAEKRETSKPERGILSFRREAGNGLRCGLKRRRFRLGFRLRLWFRFQLWFRFRS